MSRQPGSTTCASSILADVPSLGTRGGGWVALQFALMLAILVLGVVGPGWDDVRHGLAFWQILRSCRLLLRAEMMRRMTSPPAA